MSHHPKPAPTHPPHEGHPDPKPPHAPHEGHPDPKPPHEGHPDPKPPHPPHEDPHPKPPHEENPKPKPFDTKQWQKRDQNVKIEKFIATAVKMPGEFDPKDPKKQLIHWRDGGAYQQDGNWRSTSYDTRKWSKTDPVIEVQLISKNFMVSSSAPYYWETNLAKEFTTTDIYNLLIKHKFNQYLYNGEGSGCLTWTTALVKLLEDDGVLPHGSEASFLKKVEEVRADPKYWVPEEPGAHFY